MNKDTLTPYERKYLISILNEKRASLDCDLFTSTEGNQRHICGGIDMIDKILSIIEEDAQE